MIGKIMQPLHIFQHKSAQRKFGNMDLLSQFWYKIPPVLWQDKIYRPIFNWSIFIRPVIDRVISYNLNWPKIKL